MKSDQYLNMCLEQASQSPLRYRHGCVIVRGGKVIGQGFNDFRPGYNGGTLKTGRLPAGSFPALASISTSSRSLANTDLTGISASKTGDSFAPFAGMAGSHYSNTAFTMHSEMMAVNSVLASLGTLAANAASQCLKLPGDAKQRRQVVREYVERVCREEADVGQYDQQPKSCNTGLPSPEEWRFEAHTHRCHRAREEIRAESEREEQEPETEKGWAVPWASVPRAVQVF